MQYFRQLSRSFVMLSLLTFILSIGFSGIALADEKATEEKAPMAEETAPAAEETAPAAEETAPAAEETAPAAEETAPAAEETAPPAK